MKLPLLASLLLAGASAWGEADRVRLDQVEVITLTRGAWTTGRHVFVKVYLYYLCELLRQKCILNNALWHKGGHFKKKLSENVQL